MQLQLKGCEPESVIKEFIEEFDFNARVCKPLDMAIQFANVFFHEETFMSLEAKRASWFN